MILERLNARFRFRRVEPTARQQHPSGMNAILHRDVRGDTELDP
jgi:hypothetical protein